MRCGNHQGVARAIATRMSGDGCPGSVVGRTAPDDTAYCRVPRKAASKIGPAGETVAVTVAGAALEGSTASSASDKSGLLR